MDKANPRPIILIKKNMEQVVMLGDQDVDYSLISAVRKGRLERVRELIYSLGLSDSQGYGLLCDAIKYHHTAVAKLLLTSGCKVNSKNKEPYDTPLHFAVFNGDIEIIKMILDKGANVDAKNQYGRTPLQNAIIDNKNVEVTELLLKYRADVNAGDNCGSSLLHVAAEIGCLQIIKHLLKYGADVNYVCTATWKNKYAPLHFAVEKDSKEVIALLLNGGANVDVKGEDDITPLHVAAKKGYIHIAEDLLNHGACIHSLTLKEGYMPLHFACELDNEEAVKLFLNRGANINARTKGNLTPLLIATKTGCKTVLKILLQHGANVDNQDKDGKTVLQLAVEKGSLTMVEDVLKYCPVIDKPSSRSSLEIAVHGYGEDCEKIVEALLEYGLVFKPEDANNPALLHAAVEKGYLKVIEDLLKYGADVKALYSKTFYEDFTPLHTAANNKQEEAAKLLISYKADINAQDKIGKTPIFYAVENADLKMTKLLLTNRAYIKDSPEILYIAVQMECIEIIEALLEYNANVNSGLDNAVAPLHYTALIGNKEIAIMLLNKGADINYKNKNGITSLHIAAQEGYTEVVKVLLEYGAEVDSKMKNAITPLHLGAKNGHEEVVRTILKFGADVNSRDDNGRTALHTASEEGHIGTVLTLLENGADVTITSRDNHTPLDDAMAGIMSFYTQLDNCDYEEDWYNDAGPGSFTCEITAQLLIRHIVKMKTANLCVSEHDLISMGGNYDVTDFQDVCEKEIASMKSEKINNLNISFYDILIKDTSSLAIYMRNENIVQVLKSDDYKTKFPAYASIISSRFRNGMERKELLEQSYKSFHFLFNGFPELPYGCTEKIISYLSDKDLRILIDACKPFIM